MGKTLIAVFLVMIAAFALAMQMDRSTREEPAQARPEISTMNFRPEAPGANAATIRREPDGHFWAETKANGVRVRFMVDTGASTVALTLNDAIRMGLDPNKLEYDWTIRTANGNTKGASVLIDEISIGGVKIENIEGMVLREGLSQSLLGMTFLSELNSYEVRRNTLIIRQ